MAQKLARIASTRRDASVSGVARTEAEIDAIVSDFLQFAAKRDARRSTTEDGTRLARTVLGGNARVMREVKLVAKAGQEHPAVAGAQPSDAQRLLEAITSNICEGMPIMATEMAWALTEDEPAFGVRDDDHWRRCTQYMAETMAKRDAVPLADSPTGWLERLQSWHGNCFSHCPRYHPGNWKPVENMVGGALTVPPDQVEETLLEGYELISNEDSAFVRSCMAEYLITATHPFVDGNGRLSRLAANQFTEGNMVMTSRLWRQYVAGLQAIRHACNATDWVTWRYRCLVHSEHLAGDDVHSMLRDWTERRLIADVALWSADRLAEYRQALRDMYAKLGPLP